MACGGTRRESPTPPDAPGARGGLSRPFAGDGGPLGGTLGEALGACTAMITPFGLEGGPRGGSIHGGGSSGSRPLAGGDPWSPREGRWGAIVTQGGDRS